MTTRRRSTPSRARSTSSPTSSRTSTSRRSSGSQRIVPVRPGAARARGQPGPADREDLPARPRHRDGAFRRGGRCALARSGARVASACPAILKTRRFGYDGKGQVGRSATADDAERRFAAIGGAPAILEELRRFRARDLDHRRARRSTATVASYDLAENVHRDGILHTSTVPARDRRRDRSEARADRRANSRARSTMSA